MFNWIKNTIKPQSSGQNSNRSENATIRVIGDRTSGKTTYMAALARYPNARLNSPVQNISPTNEDGKTLVEMAQNILEQGLALEPTRITDNIDDLKDYKLRVTLALNGEVNLDISCKDYPGEFFNDLLNESHNPRLKNYLHDCLEAQGIMLLIDGTSRKYKDITASIDRFLSIFDGGGNKLRIAVVLTKCEQPELWVTSQNPQAMVSDIFPQVFKKLQLWQRSGRGNVEYFAASAFGMLGNSSAPNFTRVSSSRDGLEAVIQDSKRWRPFGLVAPIYWLCTGEKHKNLEGE